MHFDPDILEFDRADPDPASVKIYDVLSTKKWLLGIIFYKIMGGCASVK